MNRFILLQLAIVIFASALSFGQSSIEAFSGIHYHTSLSQDDGNGLLEEYWKPSLDAGVRVNTSLTKSINLCSSLFYNHYMFSNFYHIGEYSDTERVFVGSVGESSNVFRIMAEVQFIDQSDGFAKPYVDFGGGYVMENMGTIHGRIEYLKYITYSKDLEFSNNRYFAYTMGVGGIVTLSAYFIVDFSIKYYSNTTDRTYCLYSLGLGYRLSNWF